MSNNNTSLAVNSLSKETQTVLDLLKNNPSVTTTDLRDQGVHSAPQRIRELRQAGYKIKTTRTTTFDHTGAIHVRVGCYWLEGGAV